MNISALLHLSFLSLASLAFAESAPLALEDKKGRAMDVTLVRKEGDKVVIRRINDGSEFAISPDILSDASKKLILEEAAKLKAYYPPLESDIVIGTRRKPENDSYYMRTMEVTAEVELKNKDYNIPCPEVEGSLILIGENQGIPVGGRHFNVLSTQPFKLTPTSKGSKFFAKPTLTTYDSDNKGEGNVGGYKYIGYLLIVTDKEKNILLAETRNSKLKAAIERKASFIKEAKVWPVGTYLDEDMNKLKN